MNPILLYIEKHFEAKTDYFKRFSEADTRIEGWLKGELISLFVDLAEKKIIESFQIEISGEELGGDKGQVDFFVKVSDKESFIFELKSMVISKRKTGRDLKFYCGKDRVGFYKDFAKMEKFKVKKEFCYFMAFIYPRPSLEEYKIALGKLAEISPLWCPLSEFKDANDSFHISIWKRA